MHSVAHVSVSVSDEPAHVEAEGEEAGSQQVTQSGQIGDGEVVWVHSSTPHPVNHPVCQVEEDHHLDQDAEANILICSIYRNCRCPTLFRKQQKKATIDVPALGEPLTCLPVKHEQHCVAW